jgi:hypothetical protein
MIAPKECCNISHEELKFKVMKSLREQKFQGQSSNRVMNITWTIILDIIHCPDYLDSIFKTSSVSVIRCQLCWSCWRQLVSVTCNHSSS